MAATAEEEWGDADKQRAREINAASLVSDFRDWQLEKDLSAVPRMSPDRDATMEAAVSGKCNLDSKTGECAVCDDPGKQHVGSWRHAVRSDWRELRLAPSSVCGDREAVLGAIGQDAGALQFATTELKSDKAFIMQAVRTRGEALRWAAPELQADREVAREAIAQDRLALRHASEELRADVDLLAESMRLRERDPTLQCATAELGGHTHAVREASHTLDPDWWRTKVFRDWQRLSHAPLSVRADRKVVQDAIQASWGLALCYASPELQADRSIVLQAVRYRGEALRYASADLRDDKDVVLEAVGQSWRAFEYASEDMRGDSDIITAAMMQSTDTLMYVREDLRSDRELILRAVQSDGLALRYASEELREDREVVREAFKHNNMALRYVPDTLRREVWEASHVLLEKGHTQTTTRWMDQASRPTAIEAVAT